MKKYLILASAALVVFAACNKEAVDPAETQEDVVLTFTSERPQIDNEDTKTEWSTNKIVWSTGDKIRVGYKKDGSWMGQSEPGTAKFYKSDAVSINGTNASVGTFSVPISGSAFTDPAVSGTYQFFAVSPGDAISGTDVADPTAKNITLPAIQTPGDNTFDKTADILVGQSEATSLSGLPTDPIEITWTRLVAHADISFSNLAFVGSETVNKITLTFNSEAKVAGSFAVNIPAGTAGAGTTNELVLNGSGITSGSGSAEAWACVLPVTFTSVSVELKTDKAIYTRNITGISKTFKQNARNTLTINMSSATRTAHVEKVADGNYVIVAYDGSSKYYALSSVENGTSGRRERSEITTVGFAPGNYSTSSRYTADNSLIWTVTNVAGGVKINLVGDTNSYLKYNNSNKLPLGTSGDSFEVGDGATTGTFTLVNTEKYIAMNGSNGFACYASSTGVHDLFFVPATGTPTLVFPITAKKVVSDAESVVFAFSAYFLTNEPTVSVTADDGGAVASTDIEDGVLTVNLNENTTSSDKDVTLTVSSTGATSVVLSIKQGRTGDASTNDVLWSEAFSGYSAEEVPTVDNYSTAVFGCESVTYTCTGVAVKAESNAGGSSPEILVSKTSGSFVVTGIPTGNSTGMTLSFKSNNGNYNAPTVAYGDGYGSAASVSAENLGTSSAPRYGITVPSGTKNIKITITNTSGSNTRLDDFLLVAGAPVPHITVATSAASATASAAGTTATLNGTLALVDGASNASVTSAGFYYKVSGSGGAYTKVTCASAPTATTSFSYDLTGLTTGTTYTYYAWAVYNSGSEVTGTATEKTFTPTQSSAKTNQMLFHESFGDNSDSARAWNDSYSVKTGVEAVYSGITSYTVSNVKQGKNTTGSTLSGLNQSTKGTDAYIIIGPLSVASAENMVLTYQWKAASIGETYSTHLYYATSSGGSYTEVSGTGNGATTFVTRTYSLPVAAQVSTLYLKIVWNTSNTQAIIDEVNLQGDN